MGKGHLTLLDVCAAVKELRDRAGGARLSNIYSCSNSQFLLRFDLPVKGGPLTTLTAGSAPRLFVVIENGIRIHWTKYQLLTTDQPNGFAMKLRKHLKGLILVGLVTVGFDRVVKMTFRSSGKGDVFYLVVELFGKGNVLLLNSEMRIMTLLRVYELDEGINVKVGEIYSENRDDTKKLFPFDLNVNQILLTEEVEDQSKIESFLTTKFNIPRVLAKYVVRRHSSENFSKEILEKMVNSAIEITRDICQAPCKGYLVKEIKKGNNIVDANSGKDFDKNNLGLISESFIEFSPFPFEEISDSSKKLMEERDFFNDALDDFFIRIDQQRQDSFEKKQEKQAVSKAKRIKEDHAQRLAKLRTIEEKKKHEAEAIEYNIDLVDAAINAVNDELASGTMWTELDDLISDPNSENPIVNAILSLALSENKMTLSLTHPELDESQPIHVQVDLSYSAFANASKLYDAKKKSSDKANRTEKATDLAMKRANAKGEREKKRNIAKAGVPSQGRSLLKRRKKFWFEKFLWFVSSDGLLVLGGRDAQQNEKLVKYYLKPGDKYVHADLHGASTVIVKVPDSSLKVPENTLVEAGTLSLCRSSAWDAKVITSAYWVNADQVSKTAPTGLYLPTGSFMVRGKKNYLPPTVLQMGFGIVFKADALSASKMHSRLLDQKKEDDTIHAQDIGNSTIALSTPDTLDSHLKTKHDEVSSIAHAPSFEYGDFDVTSQFLGLSSPLSGLTMAKSDKSPDDQIGVEKLSPSESMQKEKKKGISRYERKALKKGKDPSSRSEFKELDDPSSDQRKSQTDESTVPDLSKRKQLKLKKIKKKYGDQDEEERLLRSQLIGTKALADDGNIIESTSKNSISRSEDVSESIDKGDSVAVDAEEPELRTCYFCGGIGHVVRLCPQLQGKDSAFINRIVKESRKQDVQEELDAQAIEDIEKELKASIDVISTFFGDYVDEEDSITSAIAMCAPWPALRGFRYKVKLVPGNMKIGQISKDSLHRFISEAEKSEKSQDLELIKLIPMDEMNLVLIGNSVIVDDSSTRAPKGKSISRMKGKPTNKKGHKGK